MSLGKRVAIVAALATIGTSWAAPVHAESRSFTDARGDVRAAVSDSSDVTEPAPGRANGDITSLRVDHRAHRLVVVIRYDALLRPRGGSDLHEVRLRTSAGRHATAKLQTVRRAPQGTLLWSWRGRLTTCEGLGSRIDYAADTVRIGIPRRCFGNPGAVRVGARTYVSAPDRLFIDDALRDDSIRFPTRLGPAVRADAVPGSPGRAT